MSADAVIEVDSLVKRYGSTEAVRGVSFEVRKGEVFGLLGPNGAGKTSTVECIQGLRRPNGGTIRLLGAEVPRQIADLRGRIGSQLQDSALPDRMRVWETLEMFASLAPEKLDWRPLVDEWQLGEVQNTPFGGLSGGERQRLFIALALIVDPEVVFLDELTQGLDPAARLATWELIREVRDRGATVVLVTHFMDEAEELCDRLAIVADGRVKAMGTARELIAQESEEVRIKFTSDEADLQWLGKLDCVSSVSRREDTVEVLGEGQAVPIVGSELVARGIVPHDMRVQEPDLEDIYLKLTS